MVVAFTSVLSKHSFHLNNFFVFFLRAEFSLWFYFSLFRMSVAGLLNGEHMNALFHAKTQTHSHMDYIQN